MWIINSVRKTVEKWMYSEEVGFIPGAFLYLLSLFYGVGVRTRFFLYSAGIFRSKRLGRRVISVGNLTVGGTGKTPVTILLAGFFKKRGLKVTVLSRGYKGSAKGVSVVSDGSTVLMGPDEAGDEPYLMAKRLEGVPVVVGGDRVNSGLLAIERFSPDVILLDDGFQHIRLERDLDIVLVDSKRGFGGGYLLPRGILREPVGGIKRAGVVMVKGGRSSGFEEQIIKRFNIPEVSFFYRPCALIDLRDKTEKDLDLLKGKKVLAVSGIADPESFLKTLVELKVDLVKSLVFPDHHGYTRHDMERIKEASGGADMVLTTEKDAVRLEGFIKEDLLIHALSIEAVSEGRIFDLLSPFIGRQQ